MAADVPAFALSAVEKNAAGKPRAGPPGACCLNPCSLVVEPPPPTCVITPELVNGCLWEVDYEASSLYSNISTIDLYQHCHPGRPFPFRLYWIFTEFAMKTYLSNGVMTHEWYHEEDLKLYEMLFVGKPQVKNSEVMGRVEIQSHITPDGTRIKNTVTLLAEKGQPGYDEEYYMADEGATIYIVARIHSEEPLGSETPRGEHESCEEVMDLATHKGGRQDLANALSSAIPSQLKKLRREKTLSHSLPQLSRLSNRPEKELRSEHMCNLYQCVTVWRRTESSPHYKSSSTPSSRPRSTSALGNLPGHMSLGLKHMTTHSYGDTGAGSGETPKGGTNAYAQTSGEGPEGATNAYAQTSRGGPEGNANAYAQTALISEDEDRRGSTVSVGDTYFLEDDPAAGDEEMEVSYAYLQTADTDSQSAYRTVVSPSPVRERKARASRLKPASRFGEAPLSYFGKEAPTTDLAVGDSDEEDTAPPHVMTGDEPLSEEEALCMVHEMSESSAKEMLSKLMLGAQGEENRARLEDHCSTSHSHKKAYELHGGRDWNQEYQILMDERLQPAVVEKEWCAKMYRLGADFSHAASLYAQVIINELSLPPSQKTILPVKIGGEAGGIKYMVNGILFKFAKDSIVYGSTYMYGGKVPRHDLAKKAARLELQGLSCFIAAGSNKLRLPLMTTIDYLGHRMVATSILPISHDTLRYGSADGGATVMADNPELNEEMRYVGEFWNLAEHSVGKSHILLFTPGDLEGHQGKDGRYYVCDFARLMPPESPSWEHVEVGREVFYKLLRPELVIRYAQRLSSDTFTGWGAYDRARTHQEAAIIGCSQYLYEKVIPRVAAKLDDVYFHDNPYASSSKNFWLEMPTAKLADLLDRVSVSTQMHFAGVNFRHIGLVRRHSTCSSVKLLLLCYAVARVVKNLIRIDMFDTMTKLSHPSDLEFRMQILDHLNCLLSNHIFDLDAAALPATLEPLAAKELEFWGRVEALLNEQFEHCWPKEEGSGGLALLHCIDRRIVLHYLLACSGIKLSRSVSRQLLQSTHENTFAEFVIADIKYPRPRTKQPFIYDIVAAKLLLPSDENSDSLCVSKEDLMGKLRQIQLAKEKCKRAWKQVPLSPTTSYTFARIVLRGVELTLQATNTPSWSLYYDLNLASTGLEMCSKVFPTTQTMSLWRKLLLLSGKLCHVYSQHADSKIQGDNLSEILLRLQEKIVFLEGMSEKLPAIHNTNSAPF